MDHIKVNNFDLKKTLECGQFFRYKLIDDWYFVSHRDFLFKVNQQNDKLIFEGSNEKFIRSFFRLDIVV